MMRALFIALVGVGLIGCGSSSKDKPVPRPTTGVLQAKVQGYSSSWACAISNPNNASDYFVFTLLEDDIATDKYILDVARWNINYTDGGYDAGVASSSKASVQVRQSDSVWEVFQPNSQPALLILTYSENTQIMVVEKVNSTGSRFTVNCATQTVIGLEQQSIF